MHDVVLILNYAGDEHEAFVQHHHPILIVKIGTDNHTGSSRFIFQCHKDQPLRRSGALARNDAAGGRGLLAMRKLAQFDGRLHAARAQNFAALSHGMMAGGQSRAVIVSH